VQFRRKLEVERLTLGAQKDLNRTSEGVKAMRDYKLSEEELDAIVARHPEPPSVRKRPKAEVVKLPVPMNEPPAVQLSEAELIRRQQLIDQAWERTLEARRELEAVYPRTCHRGPGDSDWGLR
jgi:hypothetical protein